MSFYIEIPSVVAVPTIVVALHLLGWLICGGLGFWIFRGIGSRWWVALLLALTGPMALIVLVAGMFFGPLEPKR